MSDPSDPPGPPDSADPAGVVDRVERRLSAEHSDVLDGLSTCADAVATEWNGGGDDHTPGETSSAHSPRTTDRDAVVPAFQRALDAAGLLAHLPRVLSDLVTAAGRPMPAPPVAAPPYVVVTSEGVLLRASLGDGRLVVSLRVFDIDRAAVETGYVRRDGVDARVEFR
ncbi:hypothetical protein C474_01607 [Halogeometricum pallidum JCM 14848]|uniref:DUF7988 domain-containing protein n=1 Tax=Halogeometricum pallidum JCM 14848 TaxID=1227487 RepID=M0DHR5_HALPD|nr:hypothetical protein [Halogeometricum pallidum]ELZ35016.1 hypothetical protein C474_01607 [Halogeometricum pallidum JCM 14848]